MTCRQCEGSGVGSMVWVGPGAGWEPRDCEECSEACARCGHTARRHGTSGCVVGWLGPGDECHCPNDANGNPAVTCEHDGCSAVADRVDRGAFVCVAHAGPRAHTFDQVPSWCADRAREAL